MTAENRQRLSAVLSLLGFLITVVLLGQVSWVLAGAWFVAMAVPGR